MTSVAFKLAPGGPGRGRSRGGFSLAELMISIGILAVGMSILAALFPAAIAMNRRTSKNVLGSIMCENGVSVVRSAFAAGAVPKPNQLSTLAVLNDDLRVSTLTKMMCRFPQGDPDSDYGFITLHRYLNSDGRLGTEEGRQLVTVAYRRGRPELDLPVHFMMLTGVKLPDSKADAGLPSMVLVNQDGHFRIGTPVIMIGTGEFVTTRQVFRWAGTSPEGEKSSLFWKALISRPVESPAWGTSAAPKAAWVVFEGTANDPNREPRHSPALSTLVTRLSPDWR